MASEGVRAADAGYHVLPTIAGQKVPGRWFEGTWKEEYDWERFCQRPATALELELWSGWPECSVSLAGGPVVGIDIDIDDPSLACKIRDVAENVLGITPLVRFGRRPRMMMVYRTAAPFQSWNAGPLQVIAVGRQFVAYGLHPDTGQPYAWESEHPAETPIDALPEVSSERVKLFISEAMQLLPPQLRATKLRIRSDHGYEGEQATREAVESALAAIPLHTGTPYDFWLSIGMAIHDALGGDGLDLWDAWSAREGRYKAGECDKKWAGFGARSGDRITAGTLFGEAKVNGWHPPAGLFLTKREADLARQPHPAQGLLDRIKAGEFATPMATPVILVAAEGTPPAVVPATPVPVNDSAPPSWLRGLDGGLALFVDRCTATARKPQPLLTLGAALAVFGTVMGRRYAGPTGVRPNVYIIGLAASSSGKNHPLTWAQEALVQAELHGKLGGSNIASGAGMVSTLEAQPNTLYALDEVDEIIRAACDKARAPRHLTEITRHLLSFYTSSHTGYNGTDYANRKEKPRTRIEQPSMSLFGVCTPEAFWSAFKSGAALDGTLGRMLVFESEQNYPMPRAVSGANVIPADLLDILKQVDKGVEGHKHFPAGDSAVSVPNPYVVGYASTAARSFADDMAVEETNLCRKYDGRPITSLYGRTCEQVQKLALIKAVAANPHRPQLRLCDLEWGAGVYQLVVQRMATAVEQNISDNDYEASLKKMAKVIRDATDADPRGASMSDVTRRCQSIDGKRRRDIIESLMEGGEVEMFLGENSGGRIPRFYRWIGA